MVFGESGGLGRPLIVTGGVGSSTTIGSAACACAFKANAAAESFSQES